MTEKRKSGKGNPNPSPATRFQVGNNGNPKGKTSDQKKIELRNAEAAMRIRERMLQATEANLDAMTDADIMKLIEPAMLKLLADSEARGLGAPVQAVDHTTNGKDLPGAITMEMTPQEAAEAYARAINPEGK